MGNTCSIASETCGFQCTNYSGAHVWKKLHAAVESIECGQCQEHAVKMMKGLHDTVNAGLGEKIYDKKNFRQFVNEVNCVYNACVERGHCDAL